MAETFDIQESRYQTKLSREVTPEDCDHLCVICLEGFDSGKGYLICGEEKVCYVCKNQFKHYALMRESLPHLGDKEFTMFIDNETKGI